MSMITLRDHTQMAQADFDNVTNNINSAFIQSLESREEFDTMGVVVNLARQCLLPNRVLSDEDILKLRNWHLLDAEGNVPESVRRVLKNWIELEDKGYRLCCCNSTPSHGSHTWDVSFCNPLQSGENPMLCTIL